MVFSPEYFSDWDEYEEEKWNCLDFFSGEKEAMEGIVNLRFGENMNTDNSNARNAKEVNTE